MKLKFESIFETFLLIIKKRYIGLMVDKCKMIYKGIVISKRDNYMILKNMYSSLIEMIINLVAYEKIIRFIKGEFLSLIKNYISLKSLIIIKILEKKYSSVTISLFVFSIKLKDLMIEARCSN